MRLGILKLEALLVTGHQMRRNECPHRRQCGATGSAHAGCLRCGNSPESDIFGELNAPEQSGWKQEEDGSYVFLTGIVKSYRNRCKIQ